VEHPFVLPTHVTAVFDCMCTLAFSSPASRELQSLTHIFPCTTRTPSTLITPSPRLSHQPPRQAPAVHLRSSHAAATRRGPRHKGCVRKGRKGIARLLRQEIKGLRARARACARCGGAPS